MIEKVALFILKKEKKMNDLQLPGFSTSRSFSSFFQTLETKKNGITWSWAKKNKNLISCRHKFKPGLISKSSGLNKLLWNLKAVQQTFERERLTWAWKEPSFWTLSCIECLQSNLKPCLGTLHKNLSLHPALLVCKEKPSFETLRLSKTARGL